MDRAVAAFADELNRVLGRYLHGSYLTKAARLAWPLWQRRVTGLRVDLDRLGACAEAVGVTLPHARPADVLAHGYTALREMDRGVTHRHAIDVPGLERHREYDRLTRATDALRDVGQKIGVRFFVHGSWSTLDATDYSDLDTLAVLPRELVCDATRLRGARRSIFPTWRVLRRFDPLQHHGHFVLTEIDLDGYPAPMFPAEIWMRATSLHGAQSMVIRTASAPELAQHRFRQLAQSFLRSEASRGLRNAYRLKSDLSVFMLLPCLWLQARGESVSKRESFRRFDEVAGPASRAAMNEASRARVRWRYEEPARARWARRLWFNALFPAMLDASCARPPCAEAVADLGENFYVRAHAVVREMLQKETRDEAGVGAASSRSLA